MLLPTQSIDSNIRSRITKFIPAKGWIFRLSLALALSTMHVIVRFCSVPPPTFEGEHPGYGQEPPNSLPFPPTTREDLRLDGYLEYSHAAKAQNIYKHPCLLRDSNPSSTASQTETLTTIPE
ncbi:uncharacterized protein TNCV_3286591 [Trichonephila clavipes]|nr:uncharacterized protein TNCV_3286591 [Trichonephila clavipes]